MAFVDLYFFIFLIKYVYHSLGCMSSWYKFFLVKHLILLNCAIAEGDVHLGFSSIICFSLDHICNDLILLEFVTVPVFLRPHKP